MLAHIYCIEDKKELLEIIKRVKEGLRVMGLEKILDVLAAEEIEKISMEIKYSSGESISVSYRRSLEYPLTISYMIDGRGMPFEMAVGGKGAMVTIKYKYPIRGFISLTEKNHYLEIKGVEGLMRKIIGVNPWELAECTKEAEFKETNPYRVLQTIEESILK